MLALSHEPLTHSSRVELDRLRRGVIDLQDQGYIESRFRFTISNLQSLSNRNTDLLLDLAEPSSQDQVYQLLTILFQAPT